MCARRSRRLPRQEELSAAFELWYGSVLRAVEGAPADRAIDVAMVRRERASVSETARWGLVDRFLHSPEAAGLVGAELLVRCAIDYKLDWADGDPLRWSPELVADFLLDWLPRQEMLVATVGTPVHLRAWVRYAGRLAGLHPAYVEATVASVAGAGPFGGRPRNPFGLSPGPRKVGDGQKPAPA